MQEPYASQFEEGDTAHHKPSGQRFEIHQIFRGVAKDILADSNMKTFPAEECEHAEGFTRHFRQRFPNLQQIPRHTPEGQQLINAFKCHVDLGESYQPGGDPIADMIKGRKEG